MHLSCAISPSWHSLHIATFLAEAASDDNDVSGDQQQGQSISHYFHYALQMKNEKSLKQLM